MVTEAHAARSVPFGAYPRATLPVVANLLRELDAERVRYCSWKSNRHLTAALAGETDLDLLVARDDALRFRALLALHGVKSLVAPLDATHPATEHYLGFDPTTAELFHLHVQYQLVLGEKYLKNYRVPVERSFLASRRVLEGVPAPCPEWELALLATRALLKYRARDVVKDVLGARSPGISPDLGAEIAWLLDQTTADAVRAALREAGDLVPSGVIGEFLEAYPDAPRSGTRWLALRTRLRHELRPFRRRTAFAARLAWTNATWKRRRAIRGAGPRKMLMPATGGVTIGLVGADGSGKSTVSEITAAWLGWKLESRRYYLGSKEPSRLSRALYVVFRGLRRGHRALSETSGATARAADVVRAGRDTALGLHHLSIGRDRSRRYERARRDANGGTVVLFDRFPLEHLRTDDVHRLLDGPQLATAVGQARNRVTRALVAAEERMYRRFVLPDHLVVLHVSPRVAAARKPDHEFEVLDTKRRAVVTLARAARERAGLGVVEIDADLPLDTVLRDVKRTVWDAL